MNSRFKLVATVINAKGSCNAGHKAGDRFEIGCYNSGGLCGFFYNKIFADLQMYEFGGKMPWWDEDVLIRQCNDPHNTVTIRIEKVDR